ncbi:MAG: 1,4-alpha-glucan branching protein GlgB [Clostridium sp.]|uniref:1,4-alpha-glucan branching protein GlgB n=1 Tax=Clostridium sp. DSM 8431 TaxID=1761781 RepID=UPI0008E389DE|nr:1,4-alpha-glucan branching protein GlgB [Clostridium sp. DSM 8431]MCR4943175.1 1,4-alpha-glucan branching protein GlgB [Clostridium sp.]SFU70742.1 1,4-alpha-glucan branching enzyme [Clostridium sp. DSM 8431]
MLETKSNEKDTLSQNKVNVGVKDSKLGKEVTITEKPIVKKEEVKVKGNNKKSAKKSKKVKGSSAAKNKKASIAASKITKEEKRDEGIEKYGRKLNKYDLTDFNTYLFHEGKNYEAYNIMGAHLTTEMRVKGVRFTTWAPNATAVYVVGSFNNFEVREEYKLQKVTEHGIWSGFFTEPVENDLYKFCVVDKNGLKGEFKSDPYGVQSEIRPNNASVIYDQTRYKWNDKKWQMKQKKVNVFESPINIYEVHLGSWKRKDNGDFLTYEELSKELPKYVKDMGYTYVEIMPILEHPLDASWGYQGTGYYSPTTRYGKLEDVKKLIDAFHNEDIGVILDWVPGHFCKDSHGLYRFDGTPTYEYQEGWRAENAGWGTCNFDLGRPEVKSYLISNALYWFREFHVDGLRVDAVSSILYLDYDRSDGQWVPNKYGGNGNLEGMQFLKDLNTAVLSEFPSGLMIAEESTAWPNISKPPKDDGLGFNFKWDMGWMNDVLEYVQVDPLYRRQFHKNITFSMMYSYSENFILPLSHDEVVHGKKSLLNKMWGDKWNKFAGVRVFATYMMAHPGKKLLFMGSEFAQFIEWREYEGLEWISMEDDECYKETQVFFKDLNHLYRDNKAFWELDYDVNGFSWIDPENKDQSILVFMRKSRVKEDTLIFIINFKSEVYYDFTIGVPFLGEYEEVFNSDSTKYGGSGQVIGETLYSDDKPFHNQKYSLKVKVPPMAALVLKVKDIVSQDTKKDTADNKRED